MITINNRYPDMVGRVILTPCDAFNNFLPWIFTGLVYLSYIPGFIWSLGQLMKFKLLVRSPLAFGWLSKRPIPDQFVKNWLAPVQNSAPIRADLTKVLHGISSRF